MILMMYILSFQMVMAGDQLEPDENGNTTPNEDINPGLGEAFDPDPPVPPPAEEGADNQTPQQDTEGSAEGTVGETAQGETQGQGQEYLEDLENPEYIGTVASDTSTAELMANMARTFAVEKSEDCDESSACLDSKAMENPAYLESPVRLPKSPSKVSFAQEGQTDIVALDNPKYGDSIQSTNSGQPLLAQKAKTFSSATGSGFLTKEYLDVVQHAGGEQALITSIQDLSKSNLTLASLGFGIAGSAISVRSNRTVLSDNGIAGLHTKSTYVKNLVALSISYMFVFTAFLSLRNLQSSINHISGLGLISLSTMYGTLVPGCVVATAIVQKMRPKWSMFVGLSSFVVYTAANFYPSYYTLLPASALVGFSLALSWIAQGTYISSIAITYAVTTGRKVENVMNLFNGIFFTFWQIAQILGNLIASLVLNSQPSDYEPMEMAAFNMSAVKPMTEYELRHINKSDPRDVVEEICGANYCHSYVIDHASLHISPKTLYILLSTFLVLGVVGLVIMAIFLNRLDVIFNRSKSSVCRQFLSIFRLLGNKKMLLCVGLMIYLGLQQAFMFAEVTKVSKAIFLPLEQTI